jgi:hypothetical protein
MANPPGVAETFVPRSSSNIAAISYEPSVENLTVEFTSGESYVYMNVPAYVYRNWCSDGGGGSYFYRNIRSRYSYERI